MYVITGTPYCYFVIIIVILLVYLTKTATAAYVSSESDYTTQTHAKTDAVETVSKYRV